MWVASGLELILGLSPVALATDGISQALTIGGPRATTAGEPNSRSLE